MTKKLTSTEKQIKADVKANKALGTEEIKFQNGQADKLITPQVGVQDSSTPLAYGERNEPLVKHDLSQFRDVIEGKHGLNLKGRLLYSLNMMAQRILRESIRDNMKVADEADVLQSNLTQEDLAMMFGFETAPMYTLDRAAHWVFITYVAVHDVAKYTEADRNGMKTTPFKWMSDIARNPFTMVVSDASYSLKSSIDSQAVQLVKLGYPEERVADSIKKFTLGQQVRINETLKAKFELLKRECDAHQYMNLGTDECIMGIEEMIADLGLTIPTILVDIAQKYHDSMTARADEGGFLGDVDEQILEFLPADAKEERRTVAAKAAAERTENVATARKMTRIPRAQAVTTH